MSSTVLEDIDDLMAEFIELPEEQEKIDELTSEFKDMYLKIDNEEASIDMFDVIVKRYVEMGQII